MSTLSGTIFVMFCDTVFVFPAASVTVTETVVFSVYSFVTIFDFPLTETCASLSILYDPRATLSVRFIVAVTLPCVLSVGESEMVAPGATLSIL